MVLVCSAMTACHGEPCFSFVFWVCSMRYVFSLEMTNFRLCVTVYAKS